MKSFFSWLVCLAISVGTLYGAEAQAVTYTVGGSITGLAAGKTVVLKNNTGTVLVPSTSTGFTFPAQNAGTNWNVSVAIQPSGQVCTVTNGSGTNISANVTNVSVSCAATYTVGGTVTGLTSGALVLRMGSITVVVNSGASTFKFASGLKNATAYNVLTAIQPPGHQCTIANGSGIITGGNITNIAAECVRTYQVGGTIIGLNLPGLTLRLTYSCSAASGYCSTTRNIQASDKSFVFYSGLKTNNTYEVTIDHQPDPQKCSVGNGSGVIHLASVNDVVIDCRGFTIGGWVNGLEQGKSLILTNAGENLSILINGAYVFGKALSAGESYNITLQSDQYCMILNASGTITDHSITNIVVTCATYFVSTIAGSPFNRGDTDGIGSIASFFQPAGIGLNSKGDAYVADNYNQKIRKVTSTGVVTTIVGTGIATNIDGIGTAASTSWPSGIAVDKWDNVYTTSEGFIRKISPAGEVSTIYIEQSLNWPAGLVVDAIGNIYVADQWNHRIVKIDITGKSVVFAGTGNIGSSDGLLSSATFNRPVGLDIDHLGNIFVVDQGNNKIRKITPEGVVTTIAGSGSIGKENGIGLAASFNNPRDVKVDSQGFLYVADTENNLIRRISPEGIVSTIAGNGDKGTEDGPAASAKFNRPIGLAIDKNDNIYVSDFEGNAIRVISKDKSLPPGVQPSKLVIGGVVTNLSAGNSISLVLNTNQETKVLSTNGGFIFDSSVDYATTYKISVASQPQGQTCLISNATGLVSNTNIKNVYVNCGDSSDYHVNGYAGSGVYGQVNGSIWEASFSTLQGIAVDSDNNLFVTDNGANSLLRKISSDGGVLTVAQNETSQGLIGIAVDGLGNYFVGDSFQVRKVNSSGVMSVIAGGGVNDAYFNYARGVAVDNQGNVYVADQWNHRIVKINSNGGSYTIAGSGKIGSTDDSGQLASFYRPQGLCVDNTGNIYVADTNNNKIRKISPNGEVTTVAGSGQPGAINGNALSATFNAPIDIKIDGEGNLYVADFINNMIRKISASGVVSTIAGTGAYGVDNGGADLAKFRYPLSLAVDKLGHVYVVERDSNLVRVISRPQPAQFVD